MNIVRKKPNISVDIQISLIIWPDKKKSKEFYSPPRGILRDPDTIYSSRIY